jgi:hypothetical protein
MKRTSATAKLTIRKPQQHTLSVRIDPPLEAVGTSSAVSSSPKRTGRHSGFGRTTTALRSGSHQGNGNPYTR